MSRIVVVDVETTGMDPNEGAALLEISHVCVDDDNGDWAYGEEGTYDSWFIAHDGDIPAAARAVHHISPEMVSSSQLAVEGSGVTTREGWLHSTLAAEEEDMYYAFHNAAFDTKFLPELKLPTICTYRCAMHIYPDAPGYSNQVLRYWLNLEPPAHMLGNLAPHRALYDTACTAALLVEMLKTHSPDELVRLTNAPILLTTCRFGKHKGALWADVPRDYMRWVLRDGGFEPDVVHTCKHYLAS